MSNYISAQILNMIELKVSKRIGKVAGCGLAYDSIAVVITLNDLKKPQDIVVCNGKKGRKISPALSYP